MSNMAPKVVSDETKFGNIINGQQFTTAQTGQDKAGLERQLPPFNSLTMGQHPFDVQQVVKNGNQMPMPPASASNNAPMANQATENGNNSAANANNA